MCGKRPYCWNTVLTSRLYGGTFDTSLPARRIDPDVGSSNPAIMRSVVVFPHPDGPSMEKNSPSMMSKCASSTATYEPKCFVTRSRLMMAFACSTLQSDTTISVPRRFVDRRKHLASPFQQRNPSPLPPR